MRRNMAGGRAFALALVILGMGAIGAHPATVSAQDEFTPIDGEIYTGSAFDWALTWDAELWGEAAENNDGTTDRVRLTSTDSQPLALVTVIGAADYSGDAGACASGQEEQLISQETMSDVAVAEVELPDVPSGHASAAFTYTFDNEGTPLPLLEYVQCQPLVADEAILLMIATVAPEDYDAVVPNLVDLFAAIEIDEAEAGEEDESPSPEADADADTEDEEDPESGVAGNAYTGVNFAWAVEWDEDVWGEPEESQGGGTDLLTLTAAEGEPAATVTFYGLAEYGGDGEECASDWGDVLAARQANSDVTEADDLDLPEAPDGQANAAYAFTYEGDDGEEERVVFVQCQALVEGEAVLIAELTTTEADFDDAVANLDDLLGAVEIDVADASEDDEDAADGAYTSPTYGYSVTWDAGVWTDSPDDELVADGEEELDRLRLAHNDGDALLSDLYVEAKGDYEGDVVACLDGEAELLGEEEGVVAFEPMEDADGEPVVGETGTGGEFAAFIATYEGDDGDFDAAVHVECRTLVEGESVLIFTLFTSVDGYESELDAAREVIDTLTT